MNSTNPHGADQRSVNSAAKPMTLDTQAFEDEIFPYDDDLPTSTRHFKPAEVLVAQGNGCRRVLEVLEGAVVLFRTAPDGRRQILEVLGPGALLCTPPGGPASATIQALSEVRVRTYAMRKFRSSSVLQTRAITQLSKRLSAIHELAHALGRKTAQERVASYLLRLASMVDPKRTRRRKDSPQICGLLSTQAALSDHLGLSLETVCRELSRLKRDGVIAMSGRGEIVEVDADKLSALAEQHLPPKPYRPVAAASRAPHVRGGNG